MQVYQTWRELLADLIRTPRERRRIARVAKVDGETLVAWSCNLRSPDVGQLHVLVQAVPQRQMLLRALIAEEFEEFDQDLVDASQNTSLIAFSTRILELYANTPDQSRFWSICTTVLSEAMKQLDLGLPDISIMSVLQCMPGREGSVCCLRESVGLSSTPGFEQVEVRTRFLGAESLAGIAVASGSPQVVDDIYQAQRPVINLPEHAVSAAAFPITHGDRVAGCFLLVSTQSGYFSSAARQMLIENYRTMLALAFSPNNFYGREHIMLQVMPTFQVQQPYLSTLQQRIVATLKTAFSANHTISYLEAQQYVCGQIAEELVRLA